MNPQVRIAAASPWPHMDQELLRLAGDGKGAVAIATAMGLRLNQVVGRMRRMRADGRLPPLENPAERADRPTLPSMAAAASPTQTPVVEARLPPPALPIPLPMPEAPAVPEPAGAPAQCAPRAAGRVTECCWPLGRPGARDFRFCDAPSEPGKQYCPDHCDLAWPLRKERRLHREGVAA